MKDGGWIPIDKRVVNLLPKKGEYSFLEAYISLRFDIETGKEISISGYSRLWMWSRNKVRYFVEGLRTGKGHVVDRQRTGKGQEVRFIFNNLEDQEDRQRTGKGHVVDRQRTVTINPINPNPINPLPPKNPATDLSDHHKFKIWWCHAFETITGNKYPFKASDAKHIQTILSQVGTKMAILYASSVLTSNDEFYERRGGRGLNVFVAQLTKFASVKYASLETDLELMRDEKLLPQEGINFEDWKFWEIPE